MAGVAAKHLEWVAFGLQLALSLATIGLVYRIALELFANSTAALGAALLLAVEPLAIVYTSLLLTETLFTFLFVLFLFFFLRYLRSNATLPLVASAVVLAAATFVRPVTYYLPIVLLAGLLVRTVWLSDRWPRLAQAAVFMLVCCLPLGAWQIRNYRVAEYPAFTASGDFNMYYHQAAWAVAHHDHKTLTDVQKEFALYDDQRLAQLHPELEGATRAQRYAFMGREGKRLVKLYFSDWAKAQLNNVAMIAANPGATNLLALGAHASEPRLDRPAGAGVLGTIRQMARETPVLLRTSLVLGAVLGATYLLSIVGWLSALGRQPLAMLVLLGICAYMVGVSCGVVEARMRHPVMPMLCLAGGMGIATVARVFAWLPATRPQALVPAAARRRDSLEGVGGGRAI